jgi:mannosyltransferase OCH1-like enzyme
LKGYEFILWNFERFDIDSSVWVKQAFEQKKYAFAADYIRLYAVYNYGGIYLDMDVEIVKPFDDLLDADIMLAIEHEEFEGIEAGCFGAEKGHPYIKKCFDFYKNRKKFKMLLLPWLMKNIKEKYFNESNYNIHSSDYFTAKNLDTGFINITENTYAIHHFASSWIAEKDKKARIDKWAFFERYGNDDFLVDFFYKMENNFPQKMPLKKLYKIVIIRTIRKILNKNKLINNIRLKIQFGI